MLDQSLQRMQKAKPEILTISNLQINSAVSGWLFAARLQTRTASNRKTYLQLTLRDQQGNEITARYFDVPGTGTFVLQEGKVVLLNKMSKHERENHSLRAQKCQNYPQ